MSRLTSIGIFFLLCSLVPECHTAHGSLRLRPQETDLGLLVPGRAARIITYRLTTPAKEVALIIEDFSGIRIGREVTVGVRAGEHSFQWNGTGNDGRKLPEGSYRLRLRALFPDGTVEDQPLILRLVHQRQDPSAAIPEPPPPQSPPHRLWGHLSGFWQQDGESGGGISTEQRSVLGVAYGSDTMEGEGVFDYRRRDPGENDLDGSSLFARRLWRDGGVSVVFRRGLSTFSDPLVLFSDFRTNFKKAGIQLDHNGASLRYDLNGFVVEGGPQKGDRGGAARMTAQLIPELVIGATGTFSRPSTEGRGGLRESSVGAVDVAFETGIPTMPRLIAETALSRDDLGDVDTAFTIGSLFEMPFQSRCQLAWIHLGESYSAPFSDPLRQIQNDASGIRFNGESIPVQLSKGVALEGASWGGYWLRRPSNGDMIGEIDASLRLGIHDDCELSLSWFMTREPGSTSHSMLLGSSRSLNPWSRLSVQGAYTTNRFQKSGRLRIEGQAEGSAVAGKVGVEWISRSGENTVARISGELTLFGEGRRGPWHVSGFVRRNHRGGSERINAYGRIQREIKWLHRYRLRGYGAFGDQAAFQTAKQIEFGMELFF